MKRDSRRRSHPSGSEPTEPASLEVSCVACHRLHTPACPFETNPRCGPCTAGDVRLR